MKITLCGSAKFEKQFHEWNKKLTLAGHVVYGLGAYPSHNEGNKDWYTDEQKATLDLVHLAKISNSDAIVVLNVGDYIGASTRGEIVWAMMHGKPCYYIEVPNFGGEALAVDQPEMRWPADWLLQDIHGKVVRPDKR